MCCGSLIFSVRKKTLALGMLSNSTKCIHFTKILYMHFPICQSVVKLYLSLITFYFQNVHVKFKNYTTLHMVKIAKVNTYCPFWVFYFLNSSENFSLVHALILFLLLWVLIKVPYGSWTSMMSVTCDHWWAVVKMMMKNKVLKKETGHNPEPG